MVLSATLRSVIHVLLIAYVGFTSVILPYTEFSVIPIV